MSMVWDQRNRRALGLSATGTHARQPPCETEVLEQEEEVIIKPVPLRFHPDAFVFVCPCIKRKGSGKGNRIAREKCAKRGKR